MHFKQPRIVEAILDIRFKNPVSSNAEDIEKVFSEFNTEYPLTSKQYDYVQDLKIVGGEAPVSQISKPTMAGYLLFSTDNKFAVQLLLKRFTFNWRGSYSNWEEFIDKALNCWKRYHEFSKVEIQGISLRYINHFSIQPMDLPNEFIKIVPKISGKIANYLVPNYFSQMQLFNNEINSFANVISGTQTLPEGKRIIILDIETNLEDIKVESDEVLKSKFEQLRKYKNEIFIESITEKTIQLIS